MVAAINIWKRPEENAVDGGEHGSGDADAKGKNRDRREEETSGTANSARGKANVPHDVVDPCPPELVARELFRRRKPSKLDSSPTTRLEQRQACPLQLCGLLIEVKLQLRIKPRLAALKAERRKDCAEP
jgi:hypothetical protein